MVAESFALPNRLTIGEDPQIEMVHTVKVYFRLGPTISYLFTTIYNKLAPVF